MSPTPNDDASPIRSYPILESPPLWPEPDECGCVRCTTGAGCDWWTGQPGADEVCGTCKYGNLFGVYGCPTCYARPAEEAFDD